MPNYLRQQKFPFGSLRTDPHWSVQNLQYFSQFRPAGKLIDETPNKNHGAINGATWEGQKLRFVADNDFVNCGISDSLNLTGDFTIIVTATPDGISAADRTIIGRSGTSHWWLLMDGAGDPDGKIKLFLSGDEHKTVQCWTADGEKRTIAVTHSAPDLTFYRDGVFLDSKVSSNADNASGATTYIGIDPRDETGLGWDGSIDYIWIWDRALSASEIAALFLNPALPFQQGMGWMGKAPAVAASQGQVIFITKAEREAAIKAALPMLWACQGSNDRRNFLKHTGLAVIGL